MRIDYPRAGRRAPWRFIPSFRQVLLVGFLGFLLCAVAVVVIYERVQIPDPQAFSTSQATVITYADGTTRVGTIGALDRVSVPLSQVPVPVQQAVLAAEDRNFYHEPGVSPTGIARALWVNVRGGELQGGSTITQQYVKNAYLTQARTFSRKIKEIFISVKLGQERSKDQILQDYLNTIYFGRGAYGIEAASRAYFGKDVSQLTVTEGAVLAASIRSPAGYDPTKHPQAAKARWNYVLDGMVKTDWLTPAERASAVYPAVQVRAVSSLAGPNGYLIAAVQNELQQHGFTEDQILRGGLKVVSTYDPVAQQAALASVNAMVGNGKVPADVRTALVSVQPGTGAVRAMYGGADYQTRQFNDATMSIPPMGSTFKAYVLAAALSKGISLDSFFDGSSPQTIAGRTVHNDSDEQFGPINLVTATAHSVNTVFVQLGITVGVKNVISAARVAGLPASDPLSANASMLLGSDSAHPIDQAASYATFAANGTYAAPHFVQEVRTSSGRLLYSAKAASRAAFTPAIASDVNYALGQVISSGTGTQAAIGRPAAGKTGTTSGNVSAWFVGYTPQLSTAVAMFRDNNAPLQGIAGYSQIYGGTLPAKMWSAFMTGALAGQPVQQFPPRASVGVPLSPSPTPTPSPTLPLTPSPTTTPLLTPCPTPGPGVPVVSGCPTTLLTPSATPTPTLTSPSGPASSLTPRGRPSRTPTPTPTTSSRPRITPTPTRSSPSP